MDPRDILSRYFGIVPLEIEPLEGYDSINFKIQTAGMRYVLKRHDNSSENCELLKAEHALLLQLSEQHEGNFPTPIPSLKGSDLIEEGDFIFRLLSFVEGEFLGDIPHTDSLLKSFGVFLAKLDKALLPCYHPAIKGKQSVWDLQHFLANKEFLEYIPDARDRALVDYFFLQFEDQILPRQYKLRKSIIHNDSNDWNVLTHDNLVSGIIDFGDVCHSWLINELAVGLTYLLLNKEAPLTVASKVIASYSELLPLEPLEADMLYYLIAARLCTSVCNSAYTKTLKPDSEYITISEKPAWDLLYNWLTISPIKASDTFRKAANIPPCTKPSFEDQLKRRDQSLSKSLSISYKKPIQMSRAAFQYMYDTEGNTILDAYNNIMLAGHTHPTVVRAGRTTMARLNTNTRYLYEELLSYSQNLLEKFPSELSKVFFVNSGSAASDLAVRLAMAHTKMKKIMVLEEGYHGNTRTGISISNYKYKKKGTFGKGDNIIEVPLPNAFEVQLPDDGTAGSYFSDITQRSIKENQGQIAAFIAEPFAGCAGQVPLAKGYLQNIYPMIKAQGGVCISDEVQVGFGRLGDYFWGYEMHDVTPDIVVLGKPMGNGHPIGAVVTTDTIAQSFESGPEFFSSFGGNPVSCAIGNAVLKVIADEKLQEHAKKVGDYLKKKLLELQLAFPQIADVRGQGLFIGVELQGEDKKPQTRLAQEIKNQLRDNLILIGTDGPQDNVLKIKPPLSFTLADTEKLVGAIRAALTKSK